MPLAPFAWELPSFSDGGVNSPAPPGKDKEAGEVKAVACCAVDGCVVRVSILAIESPATEAVRDDKIDDNK